MDGTQFDCDLIETKATKACFRSILEEQHSLKTKDHTTI